MLSLVDNFHWNSDSNSKLNLPKTYILNSPPKSFYLAGILQNQLMATLFLYFLSWKNFEGQFIDFFLLFAAAIHQKVLFALYT